MWKRIHCIVFSSWKYKKTISSSLCWSWYEDHGLSSEQWNIKKNEIKKVTSSWFFQNILCLTSPFSPSIVLWRNRVGRHSYKKEELTEASFEERTYQHGGWHKLNFNNKWYFKELRQWDLAKYYQRKVQSIPSNQERNCYRHRVLHFQKVEQYLTV